MDVDMDGDQHDDYEEGEITVDGFQTYPGTESQSAGDTLHSYGVHEEPVPEKLHLRGVDTMTKEDVRDFAVEHFPYEYPQSVEILGNGGANIVYTTAQHAEQALLALSDPIQAEITESALELRKAKPHPLLPDVLLRIRQATVKDAKKEPPTLFERINTHTQQERRGFGRREAYVDLDRGTKRQRDDGYAFNDSMYDEAPAARKPDLFDDYGPSRIKRGRYGNEDLFAMDLHGHNRNASSRADFRDRSASPSALRRGDGRYGFAEPEITAMQPSPRRRSGGTPPARLNAGRDLFEDYDDAPPRTLRPESRGHNQRELFPDTPTYPASRDLAGRRGSNTPNHRRTDAFDTADETADHYSPRTIGRPRSRGNGLAGRSLEERITFGTGRSLQERITDGTGRSLEERITGGPGPAQRNSPTPHTAGKGMHIRGAASDSNPGFRIRGVARTMDSDPQDLIPDFDVQRKRNANSGKELFGDTLGGPMLRRGANDLFG